MNLKATVTIHSYSCNLMGTLLPSGKEQDLIKKVAEQN